MALEVSIHDGESQDSLVRRFQRTIQMEGRSLGLTAWFMRCYLPGKEDRHVDVPGW